MATHACVPRPVVLKVGGSVLTDKRAVRSRRANRVHELARSLADLPESVAGRIILVLGSGSFGHPTFRDHGIYAGDYLTEPRVIIEVAAVFDEYAADVAGVLGASGLPVSCIPLVQGDRLRSLDELAAAAATAYSDGRMAVLTGGLVRHEGCGLGISSDRVAARIAVCCDALMLIAITEVGGVLTREGDPRSVLPMLTVSEIEGGKAPLLPPAKGVLDRTGGMGEKLGSLAEAARLGVRGLVTDMSVFRMLPALSGWLTDGREPEAAALPGTLVTSSSHAPDDGRSE